MIAVDLAIDAPKLLQETDMSDSQSSPDTPRSTASDVADDGAARESEVSAADRFRGFQEKGAKADEAEQERVLWAGGYSAKAMVGMWVGMVVATAAIIAAAVLIEAFGWLVALGVIVAMWLIGSFVYLWRRWGIHYELTSQRFIHQAGVLTRHTDRIEVIDISDVSYHQGPIERALGVGTIVISSSDQSHPELKMVGIDEVGRVAGLIDDIRRKERRKRSVHLHQM